MKLNAINLLVNLKVFYIALRKVIIMILKIIIYLKTNSSSFFKKEAVKSKLKEAALFLLKLF